MVESTAEPGQADEVRPTVAITVLDTLHGTPAMVQPLPRRAGTPPMKFISVAAAIRYVNGRHPGELVVVLPVGPSRPWTFVAGRQEEAQ
jgi:hypothetical protein